MRRLFLTILVVSLNSLVVFCQAPNDELVYLKIIDTLNSIYNFPFYHENLILVETKEYAENQTDTFSIFDPYSYEIITKLGRDFQVHYDSLNFYESQLYKQRLLYQNGLYLIGKINKNSLHTQVKLQDYIALESCPDLQLLGEFTDELFKNGKIGNYDIKQASEENAETYKYAIKAYIAFSGVQWGEGGRYCVVECGFHYRYEIGGTSGGGFHAILEKTQNSIEIIKFIGLWEE